MSGIAIIIPGADFSSKGLGKVSRLGDLYIQIQGPSVVDSTTESATYTIDYTPSDTMKKGVTWSSSNTYVATVDSDGRVTFIHGTSDSVVTIKATSIADTSVTAQIEVTVKAAAIVDDGQLHLLANGRNVTGRILGRANGNLSNDIQAAALFNRNPNRYSLLEVSTDDPEAYSIWAGRYRQAMTDNTLASIGIPYDEAISLGVMPLVWKKEELLGKTVTVKIASPYQTGLSFQPYSYVNQIIKSGKNVTETSWGNNWSHSFTESDFSGEWDSLYFVSSVRRSDNASLTDDDVKAISQSYNLEFA